MVLINSPCILFLCFCSYVGFLSSWRSMSLSFDADSINTEFVLLFAKSSPKLSWPRIPSTISTVISITITHTLPPPTTPPLHDIPGFCRVSAESCKLKKLNYFVIPYTQITISMPALMLTYFARRYLLLLYIFKFDKINLKLLLALASSFPSFPAEIAVVSLGDNML